MTYTFKSKAAGDVIMLAAVADGLLGIIGKEAAPRGIIEPAAMPAAIAALQAAIAEEGGADARSASDQDEPDAHAPRAVSLGARAWPLIEMLREAHAAGEPVVWGV